MRNFAAKLKQHRQAAGLSQATLAEEAAVTKSYLAKLEQGTSEPSGIAVIEKIASALAISPAFLLGNDPPTDRAPLRRDGALAAGAIVDTNLWVTSCTDTWSELLPGSTSGSSLLEWLFKNPRAQLVLENWTQIAHAAAWWTTTQGSASSATDRVRAMSQFRRLSDLPFTATNQARLFKEDGLSLRTAGTSTIEPYTLDIFRGLTVDAYTVTLSRGASQD